MSLGSDLRQIRESKRITLETVSRKTKIPPKYLEAIEENKFQIFPSHTYAKGFIRAYAKVVGADPQLMTRHFEAEVGIEPVKTEPQMVEVNFQKKSEWNSKLNKVIPLKREHHFAGELNLEMVEESPEESFLGKALIPRRKISFLHTIQRVRWGVRILMIVVILGGLILGANYGWKALAKFKWGGSKSGTAAGALRTYEPIPVADKYQHLILKGLDKSWVLVTMDGGQSSSEVDLVEGEVRTYQAVKSFTLKIGNAGGVDIQFNGKPLGILGVTGQVVEINLPLVPDTENENTDDGT
jgi:transcriptional regulator with XRE-family HTH domain